MAIDQSLLLKIKTSLRISHSVLDEDLSDTIAAGLQHLKICGRKEYPDDPVKAAEYQRRYDAMKSCLMMASEYSGEAAADE